LSSGFSPWWRVAERQEGDYYKSLGGHISFCPPNVLGFVILLMM